MLFASSTYYLLFFSFSGHLFWLNISLYVPLPTKHQVINYFNHDDDASIFLSSTCETHTLIQYEAVNNTVYFIDLTNQFTENVIFKRCSNAAFTFKCNHTCCICFYKYGYRTKCPYSILKHHLSSDVISYELHSWNINGMSTSRLLSLIVT